MRWASVGGCLPASVQPLAAPLAQTICPRMPLYLRLRVSVIMRCERGGLSFCLCCVRSRRRVI